MQNTNDTYRSTEDDFALAVTAAPKTTSKDAEPPKAPHFPGNVTGEADIGSPNYGSHDRAFG